MCAWSMIITLWCIYLLLVIYNQKQQIFGLQIDKNLLEEAGRAADENRRELFRLNINGDFSLKNQKPKKPKYIGLDGGRIMCDGDNLYSPIYPRPKITPVSQKYKKEEEI